MKTWSLPDLAHAIDDHRDGMRRLLAALVAVPTENPPGRANLACVAAIETALQELGIPYERIAIPAPPDAPRAAVFGWVGSSGPALYFHGHYDVVPAASQDQFVPRIDGDTLFGRGSSDMKSGLVAMLYAAAAVRSAAVPLAGRIGLVFVPDEETGGRYGSAWLSAEGHLGRDGMGMLLPEPTSGAIWHANRGAITLEVVVKGRPAHIGLMHEGINAFERAIPLVDRLFELKRETDAAGSILLVGGRVEAGVNFNVVPAECRFTIDLRVNPGEDLETEKVRLLRLLDAARSDGLDLDVRTMQEGRSALTSPDTPLGHALAESASDVTGRPAPFELCPGLLETRFYAERQVPAFAYGPGILAVSHGPKEFVRISRMVECAKIYALTAARTLARA